MKSYLVKLVDDTAGLSDVLVTIPYLDKFREHSEFEIFFQSKNYSWGLFKNTFPNIKFVSKNK
jgi:hypothetical protein